MQVAQDQKGAVVRIQVAFEHVSNRGSFGRIGGGLSPNQQQPLDGTSPATASSVRIERAVACDREQPSLLVHNPLQLAPVFERRKQRLLQKVFGELTIAHELHEKPPDPAAMLLDQPIEGSVSLSRMGLRAHHCERCRLSVFCDTGSNASGRRRSGSTSAEGPGLRWHSADTRTCGGRGVDSWSGRVCLLRHHHELMDVVTVAERPDLIEPGWERTRDVIPEYNNHGDVLNRYWGRLTEERPDFQFHLVGDGDEILARARSIPVRWGGRVEDLPEGIDGAIARGFEEGEADVLCALVIMVPRDLQGRGLSAVAVKGMLELARRHGLAGLIAPVRPSWKERYPLIPIERYAVWRRPDGLFFDPWMRVHERLGATVLKPEPQSLRIIGTVAEWEEWTQMAFPETGDYWFPGGLTTVRIDREGDRGSYWEPNVWMRHAV